MINTNNVNNIIKVKHKKFCEKSFIALNKLHGDNQICRIAAINGLKLLLRIDEFEEKIDELGEVIQDLKQKLKANPHGEIMHNLENKLHEKNVKIEELSVALIRLKGKSNATC